MSGARIRQRGNFAHRSQERRGYPDCPIKPAALLRASSAQRGKEAVPFRCWPFSSGTQRTLNVGDGVDSVQKITTIQFVQLVPVVMQGNGSLAANTTRFEG